MNKYLTFAGQQPVYLGEALTTGKTACTMCNPPLPEVNEEVAP